MDELEKEILESYERVACAIEEHEVCAIDKTNAHLLKYPANTVCAIA